MPCRSPQRTGSKKKNTSGLRVFLVEESDLEFGIWRLGLVLKNSFKTNRQVLLGNEQYLPFVVRSVLKASCKNLVEKPLDYLEHLENGEFCSFNSS